MNAAGIRALEQARGYYAGGVVNATKRVKETTQALEDAQEQLRKAQEQVAELDAALAETGDSLTLTAAEARLAVEAVSEEVTREYNSRERMRRLAALAHRLDPSFPAPDGDEGVES